jgi:hypothetical protein
LKPLFGNPHASFETPVGNPHASFETPVGNPHASFETPVGNLSRKILPWEKLTAGGLRGQHAPFFFLKVVGGKKQHVDV